MCIVHSSKIMMYSSSSCSLPQIPQKSTLTTASSGSPFSPTVPEVYDVVDCTVDDLKEIVTTDDDRKPLKKEMTTWYRHLYIASS